MSCRAVSTQRNRRDSQGRKDRSSGSSRRQTQISAFFSKPQDHRVAGDGLSHDPLETGSHQNPDKNPALQGLDAICTETANIVPHLGAGNARLAALGRGSQRASGRATSSRASQQSSLSCFDTPRLMVNDEEEERRWLERAQKLSAKSKTPGSDAENRVLQSYAKRPLAVSSPDFDVPTPSLKRRKSHPKQTVHTPMDTDESDFEMLQTPRRLKGSADSSATAEMSRSQGKCSADGTRTAPGTEQASQMSPSRQIPYMHQSLSEFSMLPWETDAMRKAPQYRISAGLKPTPQDIKAKREAERAAAETARKRAIARSIGRSAMEPQGTSEGSKRRIASVMDCPNKSHPSPNTTPKKRRALAERQVPNHQGKVYSPQHCRAGEESADRTSPTAINSCNNDPLSLHSNTRSAPSKMFPSPLIAIRSPRTNRKVYALETQANDAVWPPTSHPSNQRDIVTMAKPIVSPHSFLPADKSVEQPGIPQALSGTYTPSETQVLDSDYDDSEPEAESPLLEKLERALPAQHGEISSRERRHRTARSLFTDWSQVSDAWEGTRPMPSKSAAQQTMLTRFGFPEPRLPCMNSRSVKVEDQERVPKAIVTDDSWREHKMSRDLCDDLTEEEQSETEARVEAPNIDDDNVDDTTMVAPSARPALSLSKSADGASLVRRNCIDTKDAEATQPLAWAEADDEDSQATQPLTWSSSQTDSSHTQDETPMRELSSLRYKASPETKGEAMPSSSPESWLPTPSALDHASSTMAKIQGFWQRL